MLIERVEVQRIDMPLARPVASAGARVSVLTYLAVRLRADGLDGLGYVCVYASGQANQIEAALHGLAPAAQGQDVRLRRRVWDRLWAAAIAATGVAEVARAATSAYDLALWDLAGKAAGMPMYQLLGARRDRMPAYYSGLFLNEPLDDLLAEAEQVRAQGFRHAKMRAGKPNPAEDVARVRAVQNVLGAGVHVMVDCSRALDAERAIALGQQLEMLGIVWLEEPVPPHDLAGSAEIAAALDVPVAAGESAHGLAGVRELLDHRAADVLMPDVQRMGGLTEWLQAAALAEAHGRPVSNHLFHEVTGHGLCVCAGEPLAEFLPWPTPFSSDAQIVDGELRMGDAPGLGIHL